MAYELIQRWLSVDYLAKQPESSQILIDMLCRVHADGYASTCAALRDPDLYTQVHHIAAKVLVIGGTHD